MKKPAIFRKSVIFQWMVSYILVLSIPACCFLYQGMNTKQLLENEITSTNRLTLENLQKGMDTYISDLKSSYQFIFNNARFALSRRSFTENDVLFRSNAAEFLEDLKTYIESLSTNVDVLIFYPQKEYIITQSTANTVESMGRRHQGAGSELLGNDWLELISRRYTNEFLISSHFAVDRSDPSLVYCNTISGTREPINIFISLPLHEIEELAAPLENRLLMVSNSENTEIWCSDPNLPLDETAPRLQSESYSLSISDQEYICTTVPSSVSPWNFTILAPKSIYYNVQYSYQLVFWGCISAAVILGVVLIVLLIRANYSPVKKLMRQISQKPKTKNEFEWFQTAYSLLDSESQNMRLLLSDQSELLRSQYLLACLRGRETYYKVSDMSNSFHQQEGYHYALLAFSVDMNRFSLQKNAQSFIRLRNTYLFAINNVFEELFEPLREKLDYVKTEDGELLLYLIILPEKHLSLWEEAIRPLSDSICNLFIDEFSVPVACIIGRTTEYFCELCFLYQETQSVLEYENILGEYGTVSVTDFRDNEALEKSQKEYFQSKLILSIQENDCAAIRVWMDKLFDYLSHLPHKPLTTAQFVIYDYYSAIMASFGASLSEDAQNYLFPRIQALFLAPDLNALKTGFLNLLTALCHTVDSHENADSCGLIQQVQQFVQENYQNCNLNINFIADSLNRNPKYLSRIFYKESGYRLLDYINEIRIQKAKQILLHSDTTIEQVSQMVGYATVRTFRRAFSKIYGTTPFQLSQSPQASDLEQNHLTN